ncbi:MAG: hypothetical protein QOD77_1768 [Thermoplasmata archaeon]|nr:hypothetical protein [Thermoplasmata archaeon]
MRGLPVGWRLALLALAGCTLFFAVANAGTRASPYAPNEWLFSHDLLAQAALDDGRVPVNEDVFARSSFADTLGPFQEEMGLGRPSFYATTTWHFWNGIPLQPTLLATLSSLAGAAPEETARVPFGAFALLGLTFATADLLMRPAKAPWHALAPLALPVVSAPFVLDLRVLMPSTSLVAVAIVLHLLLRRSLLGDRRAIPLALVPIAVLPFWYYTVSYYVILLFAGFLALHLLARLRRTPFTPLVPLAFSIAVPLALVGMLLLNGALTSHLELSAQMTAAPVLGPDTGGDYASHLNREPWRSALLYAGSAAVFAPLGWLVLLALRDWWAGRPVQPAHGAFAQWAVGVGLFSAVLVGSLGVSFLNRSVIYLAPLGLLASLYLLARFVRRGVALRTAGAVLAGLVVATPLLVATATPNYSEGDRGALEWMDGHERHDAVVYSSLELSSVLFRRYGFHDAIAFRPSESLLRDFWYSTDPTTTLPYLAGFEVFVLRHDVEASGFMEFGPLREPVGAEAYGKFARSDDLHLVFDNGQAQVFHVVLRQAMGGDAARMR